jgi:hypothetical protein
MSWESTRIKTIYSEITYNDRRLPKMETNSVYFRPPAVSLTIARGIFLKKCPKFYNERELQKHITKILRNI